MKLRHILNINHCVLRPESVFPPFDSKQKLKKTNKIRITTHLCRIYFTFFNFTYDFTCMNTRDLIKTTQSYICIVISDRNPT